MIRQVFLIPLMAVGLASALPASGEEAPKLVAKATLGTVDNRTMSPYLTALSRDGKELAYRTSPDAISIFEPLSGRLIRTITIEEKEVGELVFYSPDSKHLIFQAMQQLRLVDAATGKVLRTIGGGNDFDIYAHAFLWSDDFGKLTDVQQRYDFGFKPKVHVWDGENQKVLGEIDIAPNGAGRCEAISGDGQLIATSARYHSKAQDTDENVNEYLELWDSQTLKRKGRIHLGKDAYAVMLGLNADGKYLVTVTENEDGAVIWDTATQKRVATLGRFPGGYGRITFSPDDEQFAIQSITGYTIVYETATGKKVADRQDAGRFPAGVGFTSLGDIIACFVDGSDIQVSVVNRTEQPALAKPVGHARPVILTRFSDDGKTILTVGGDNRILRWDVDTGELLETLFREQQLPVLGWDSPVQFAPDGKWLFAGRSGELSLFNIAEKKKVADLKVNNTNYWTRFSRVDFTEDMKKLIARGEGQERRQDFNIVIVGYAAAWNTEDGSLVSEFNGRKRDDGEALFAQHYGKENLLAAPAPPKNAPQVEVGPAIRDPWASSRNAGAMNVGNKLTLSERESGKVFFDKMMNLNGGLGISFSPDGRIMAVPMSNNTVQIFELP